MEKAEYIGQIKRLIKKYHPDLCKDETLESLYNEITIKLNAVLSRLQAGENSPPAPPKNHNNGTVGRNGLIPAADQGYAYYKLGIKYYKNISMDKFYKKNSDTTYETKKYDEQLQILNTIYISFKLSEYYFNKVTGEYENSAWAEDAKEKIALLHKLSKRYENINIEEDTKIIDAGKFVQDMGLNLMTRG
jgi:hypothetical protein